MFPRHGKFHVETKSNVLLVSAIGPFNEELVQDYKAAVEAAIAQLSSYPQWGQIVILEKESLFTPDAERLLVQSLKYRKLMGLRTSAVVLHENVTARSLIVQQMSKAYAKDGIEFSFFDNLAEATKWTAASV